ncbi:nuclear exosome regulator NRDE2-like isoform X2 [Eriocheir sinensis]|uniref:nuclear exosome regulator NRDE2-like isoform X2 n=1 Tax=Eriocheir sinensis TaxID=95602 RepID=UPI0021C96324|nr:nuclear exosome regulator NRDE2-like isoform X2 [Eriocheir sinensis]
MALFPAYSSEEAHPKPAASSLSWLCNPSCPPEIGQLPPQESVPTEDKEEPLALEGPVEPLTELTQASPEPKKNKRKKKEKKKKKKKKKKKEEKKELVDHDSSSSEEKKRSPRSKSRSKERSRSKSKERSLRLRSRSKERSPVRGQVKKSRSRTRSRSRGRKSKSLSRRRRSRSSSRKRRSRSRKKSRSRSRRRRSRSRSRSQRRRRISRSSSRRRRSKSRSQRRRRTSRSSSRRRRSRSRSQRKRRRSRSRSPKRKHIIRKGDQSTGGSAEKIVSSCKGVFLEDLQGIVKPEEAFFITVEGDGNNKALATTHYTQLASYKTRTRGTLGNPITRTSQRKKVIRYYKKSALRILYSDATPVKRLNPNSDTPHESYVPLNLTHAEETKIKGSQVRSFQGSEANPLGIYDSKTEQYITGKGGLDIEDSVETCQDAEYEMWQSKAKQYNERLGKEPYNVSLWLEFVRFQDDSYKTLYQGENSADERKHKVTQKALAERKIAILDSAIKKNIRSLELYFERLEIGKDLWGDKKLKQEWDALVFNFPNKVSVWHQYLANVQTHFTSFGLSSAVRMFGKCSERLQQMRDGVFMTHAPPQDIGKCLVDVATQLAHLWRQGGHMERSVALFQALVELNLFSPNHCSAKDVPLEAKLALLEPFWDSRAPRFGEEKAVGWAKVMERRETVQFPEIILEGALDEEDDLLAQGGTTARMWLALEVSRERRHWLPWEQDPEDCEDPERMVPLEDLTPHLFTLDSVEDKFYLILEFLRFLGIPEVEDLSCQGLRSPRSPTGIGTRAGSIFRPLVIETLYDANLFGNHLCKESGASNILSFDAVGPSITKPSCDDYYQFLCRVVQQATSIFEHQYRKHLTLLQIKLFSTYFQVKAQREDEATLKTLAKELKKQIKSVLKTEEFRMCLPVYQEYGRMEEALGHVSEAENIYVTALAIGTMSGKALEPAGEDFRAVIDLYVSYIRLQLDREVEICSGRHSNNILQSLCLLVNEGKFSAPDGSPATGGNLLKAKKKLLQMQAHRGLQLTGIGKDGALHENEKVLAIKVVTFLALIQLLTIGFRPACLVFESTIERVSNAVPHTLDDISLPSEMKTETKNKKHDRSLDERAKVLECLYEDYLWLVESSRRLGHLVKDGKMSPVSLRSVLAAALKVAPENQRFLLLLAQNQSWRSLIGGLETRASESCSIVGLVCKLLPHIRRTITLITNTSDGLLSCGHRLEAVLEQAVRGPPGSHCPLLWRLYLALVAATRPKGLKNLTYRALVQCPGVKSVYLDCVRLLPGMLKEVVRLLTEKGMRVRLPLEELQVLTETELEFEDEKKDEDSDSEEEKKEEEEEEEEEEDVP